MSTTVVVDSSYLPKVTLTVQDSGSMSAVIEVEGLSPTRGTTAEERARGITSLDPPTITARSYASRTKTHRALIGSAWNAVSSSATSTDGSTGGPGAIAMLFLRTVIAVRRALRLAGEDI